MSADVIEFPIGGRADDTIRRTIDALAKGKQLKPDDIAAAAGMSRSSYFSKLRARGSEKAFKAGEVAAIANYLDVQVSDLYDGLGGTFGPGPEGEPAGYPSAQVIALRSPAARVA